MTAADCLRTIAKLWFAYALGMAPLAPKPQDAPVVRSGHPHAGRILLFGNGPALGWGTVTHQLAPVGRLARAVGRRTGQPWDADFLGEEHMTAASAADWIGTTYTSYAGVVLAFGVNDAIRLTSVADWEAGLSAVVDRVRTAMPDVPIVVVDIPAPRRASRFAGPLGFLADAHAARLNTASARVLADVQGVSIVDLDLPAGVVPGSAEAHETLAEQVAERLAPLLPTGSRRPPLAERVWEWNAASSIIELVRRGASPELQRITDEVKAEFGVAMATVSIVDGDQLYYTVNTDRLPSMIPRSLSHCRVVVDEDAPIVVPDSHKDSRFRGNPIIDLTQAPFYAGFPIHASDGHTVGALCLLDARALPESAVPVAKLERFALQAQAEIQRLEAEAARREAFRAVIA